MQGAGLSASKVSVAARARLLVDVESAARLLGPMWPLHSFVAVNPLMDLLELGFAGAVGEASRWLPMQGYPSPQFMQAEYRRGRVTEADLVAVLVDHGWDVAQTLPVLYAWLSGPDAVSASDAVVDRVDRSRDAGWSYAIDAQLAAFCCAFADEGASTWGLGERSGGLYRCWRAVAACDPLLRRRLRRRTAYAIAALPADPEDALLNALEQMHISEVHRVTELRRRLVRLPGWVSYARWRQQWAAPDCPSPPMSVVDLLAVQMSYEALLVDPAATKENNAPPIAVGSDPGCAAIWLEAYERHYRDDLLAQLAVRHGSEEAESPQAQIVFCIDARSERLRRHLEATGPYATFGFAGFFGFPVAVAGMADCYATARCPVLMSAHGVVRERPAPGQERAAESYLRARRRTAVVHDAWRAGKTVPGSAFVLAEALGWWLLPSASIRTFWPHDSRRQRLATILDAGDAGGLSLDERILFAENALLSMGLVRGFARLVVLCGHTGRTTANPHASALDCGACAGAPGGPSARVAASVLNCPAVRTGLAERGICIPPNSWFVAAEHDTTTDTITILDRHRIPHDYAAELQRLELDLAEAGRRCAAERAGALPDAPRRTNRRRLAMHLAKRGADWAQIRPEWGLARNAAFVVGPRSLTLGINLDGRVFMHSYEPTLDGDGTILEGILTGPLVVAQWINAQYYFSSVAPEVFGAGDKTLHNPVGGIGVLSGEGRDLKIGLPWQSVAVGNELYHEPMRLVVVVQAPLERLDAVMERNTVLRELVGGQWLSLVARPSRMQTYVWREGTWHPWQPAASTNGRARPEHEWYFEMRQNVAPSRMEGTQCSWRVSAV